MGNILWIDDEPEYLLNYQEEIESQLGIGISFAQDIPMSIKKINNKKYDLLILDLLLPFKIQNEDKYLESLLEKYNDYTGIALIDILWNSNNSYIKIDLNRDIPIIICSSYNTEILINSYPILRNKKIHFFKKEHLVTIDPFLEKIKHLINSNQKTIIESNSNEVRDEHIKNDEIFDYYQKVRHDFLNFYSGLNNIFENTIKYLLLSRKSELIEKILNQDEFDRLLKIEINNLLKQIKNFIENCITANNEITNSPQIIKIIGLNSRLESYIEHNDSFQFYQIKDFCYDLFYQLNYFEGKYNRDNRRKILEQLKNILSFFVLLNLNEGKTLISDYLIKTTSNYYSLRDDSKIFDIQKINVIEVLTSSLDECKIVSDHQKVRMKRYYHNAYGIFIPGNKFILSKAFKQVILNAIKYTERITVTEDHPWIIIRCDKKHDSVLISIENWGVIIPKEEIESEIIFQKEIRGDNAMKKRSGLGIGLYEANKIIKLHSGKISYDSKLQESGKGLTTFYIKLPLYPDV